MALSIAGAPDEADAIGVLHAALDAGATLIDTADCYCLGAGQTGSNERLVAQALRTWRGDRSRVTVATKGGSIKVDERRWRVDGRPEHLRAACDHSLHALGTDCIDLYQLHGPDPAVPFADSVGALAELRAEGKVHRVGLSNVTVAQVDAARRIVPIDSVQNLLNLRFRGALKNGLLRHGTLEHCRRLGVTFLAFSPTGGLVHREVTAHPVVRSIAEQRRCSPHAVALAWVLAQGPHVVALVGGRSQAHVRDAMGAADLQLTAAERGQLDRAQFGSAAP